MAISSASGVAPQQTEWRAGRAARRLAQAVDDNTLPVERALRREEKREGEERHRATAPRGRGDHSGFEEEFGGS